MLNGQLIFELNQAVFMGFMMADSEKSNNVKWTAKASKGDRISWLIVFFVIVGIFAVLYMVKADVIYSSKTYGPCAFKETYNIPCPSCGMTTAVSEFMSGRILSAFYIQPGITIICVLMALIAFFSLLSVFLGLNFSFLPPVQLWSPGYIVLALFVILFAAWAVTLARAFAKLP